MKKFAALLLALALGCGGATAPATPSVTANWRADLARCGCVLHLTLAANGSALSGTGALVGDTTIAVTVTGSYVYPQVMFTASLPPYSPFVFAGTMAADGLSITGTADGSGMTGDQVVLLRQ